MKYSKTLVFSLVFIMVLSLAACSGGADTPDNEEVGGLYPEITASVRMNIQNLLPTNGNGVPKYDFYWNIYESLFDYNDDGELVPDVAKSFTVVDEKTYDVELFQTVKDSKGNAINADDVVFSITWLIDAGEAINYDFFESIEKIDDYTVRFHWKNPPSSTTDYEFPFTRSFIVDSEEFDQTEFSILPVATGNFVVADFLTGSHLTLWADPNYWALNTTEDVSERLPLHTATVQKLTYQVVTESSSAEVSLDSGNIDYCDYISQPASIEKFENDSRYTVEEVVGSTYFFLQPNMNKASALAGDINLRMAIFYALDNEYISELMGSGYTPMKTLGMPYFSDFSEDWEKEANYASATDEAKAKEYLSKSNYNGENLTLLCKTAEAEKNAAQAIMATLLSYGINVSINPVDNSLFQIVSSDPDNYDLMLFEMGGNDLVSSWKLSLTGINKPSAEYGIDSNYTLNHNTDQQLFALMEAAQADATHDDEHVKAVIDYAFENAYIYPIAYPFQCYIYTKDIKEIYRREGYTTLAASTYAEQ